LGFPVLSVFVSVLQRYRTYKRVFLRESYTKAEESIHRLENQKKTVVAVSKNPEASKQKAPMMQTSLSLKTWKFHGESLESLTSKVEESGVRCPWVTVAANSHPLRKSCLCY
jgi:hypothetical protein